MTEFLSALRSGIWFTGIGSFIFGISDRTYAALSDGFVGALDLIQLFTAAIVLVGWLFLKPGIER